jgi:hypothetical protein
LAKNKSGTFKKQRTKRIHDRFSSNRIPKERIETLPTNCSSQSNRIKSKRYTKALGGAATPNINITKFMSLIYISI